MTPLQLITKLREKYSEFKNEKIGYAGRLDPLARGVVLLMIGGATKERDKYLGLDKEYEFEVLFGVTTDTYDVLGVVSDIGKDGGSIDMKNLVAYARNHLGEFWQEYPAFSSKTVKGKPLFWWSREKRLSEIVIPKHEVGIYEFEVLMIGAISTKELQELVFGRIDLIRGDFRQQEIRSTWRKFFLMKGAGEFLTARFRVACSSGMYVRSLVHKIGMDFGTGAIALDILRTKVERYKIENSISLG
jgi:tRNA pseudouridine55 synthase